jgi:hypothetical protein
MTDNWGLKKLFHFDSNHWSILNDTTESITINSDRGQDIEVKPNLLVHINPGTTGSIDWNNDSMILPNNCTIRYSNKKIIEEPDFNSTFHVIINQLVRRFKHGHVIGGLDFLDYHYNWTKDKKRFLNFIKHYVLSASQFSDSRVNKLGKYIDAIKDWVEEKRKARKKPASLTLLAIPSIIYIVGFTFSNDYKEIFIGALIGGIASSIKEAKDLLSD